MCSSYIYTNMSVVNKILQEWSLRSLDGLASGHASEHNIAALQQILIENEIDISDVNEVLGTILAKEDAVSTIIFPIRNKNEFVDEFFHTKGLKENQALELYDVIVKNNILKKSDLAGRYNKMSYANAIRYLNNNPVGQLFSQESNKIKKMGLGRGEYALLFLIKNAMTGGTESGDLIIGNEVIDVKEFDKAGEIKFPFASIRITRAKFYKNLFEIASFITKNKSAQEYLMKLLNSSYVKGLGGVEIRSVTSWITYPSVTEVGAGVFKYLYQVGQYFKNEKKEPEAETASLRFSGEPPKSMVIQEPEKVKTQILQPISAAPIKMTVEPLVDELEQVIVPSLKNMDYFKENFTMDEITDNLIENVHYTGGIIYLRGTTYEHIKKSDLGSKLIFTRMSQSAAKFKERK